VAIIGGGPAGLLLSEMLYRHGVDSIVLEKHSRAHVLSRIRAGVLEPGTVDVLRNHGLSARMDREGRPHDGMKIAWAGGGANDFDQRAQEHELEYLNSSYHAQVALAEQYAGVAFEAAG
jgi:2-polyprenyl-6-methoxyphenol hydroxylase-like FAD-dependent oxidoreductase